MKKFVKIAAIVVAVVLVIALVAPMVLRGKIAEIVKREANAMLDARLDFEKLDIRVGRVVDVQLFPEGKYSSHILLIDFGVELGIKKSLARLVPNYQGPELLGTPVLAVVNFPARQIGKHLSEVLTLGVPDEDGHVVLLRPETDVPLSSQVF